MFMTLPLQFELTTATLSGWVCTVNHCTVNYNIFSSGLYYKSYTIIIYNHNDSTIVEPVL